MGPKRLGQAFKSGREEKHRRIALTRDLKKVASGRARFRFRLDDQRRARRFACAGRKVTIWNL